MANNNDDQKSKESHKTYESKEDLEFDLGSMDSEKIGVSEILKKLVTAGVGAAFMTEEGIRSYLNQIKLPKDVLNMILQSANNSKEELLERTASEISRILKKIDFVDEASKFVETHRFKINAEIEVIKKEEKDHK